MNVSRRWLEDFLRRPLEPRDLAERLTMLGAPVDSVQPLHADLSDVLVGFLNGIVCAVLAWNYLRRKA
jgi:hypothetical protein